VLLKTQSLARVTCSRRQSPARVTCSRRRSLQHVLRAPRRQSPAHVTCPQRRSLQHVLRAPEDAASITCYMLPETQFPARATCSRRRSLQARPILRRPLGTVSQQWGLLILFIMKNGTKRCSCVATEPHIFFITV
jgi:hypothetical protein